MNKPILILFGCAIAICFLFASCSSGNRIGGTSKKCGCGMNKGMIGY
ncbi:MAG: hypothetical protein JST87_16110 [Bacteroidetes bacterium]|nr:hypothetical protein [Bacteroidota bacterium]